MFEIKTFGSSIQFIFPSDFRLMDRVLSVAEAFMRKFGCNFRTGRIVLRELIRNAIEHGNHERKSKHVRLDVICFKDAGFKIQVSDEGMGFGHQDLEFDLPVNPCRTIANRGYKLINAHSDRIEFNDSGNEVTVYVNGAGDSSRQVLPGSEHGMSEDERVAAGNWNSKRILIIENDDESRYEMSMALHERHYQITAVASFEEALEYLGEQTKQGPKPDLIVAHRSGPNSSAARFVVELRHREIDEPVLIVIDTDFLDGVHEVPDSFHVTYLRRRFRISELIDKIQAILGDAQTSIPLESIAAYQPLMRERGHVQSEKSESGEKLESRSGSNG